MEEKVQFGKFIVQKRKEADLTQKELADKLFVTDTTVSKWERGLSYPDITLITGICKVLKISEHEFFTACDDYGARREKKLARNVRIFKQTYLITLYVLYGIAIIACFITNIAVNRKLSWFFIVLASIALAFSVTCLPSLLKSSRAVLAFAAATGCTYILEFVCCLYTGGDWLFRIGYPITTLSVVLMWLIMLTIRYLNQNVFVKAGIILLILAAAAITINPYAGYLIGQSAPGVMDYVNFANWPAHVEAIGAGITFYVMSILGIINLAAGFRKNMQGRRV